MGTKKFDPKHLSKLNDPRRVKIQDPQVVWEKLALKDPEILVDIGAGTGFFAIPFSEKMTHGTIYACDISDDMLAWLAEHLPQAARGKVVPVKMQESAVPLEDGIADLVYMVNLHHELEKPERLMAEAARILKPGGKLAVIDWKKDAEQAPFGPPVAIRVPKQEVFRQMSEAGLANLVEHDVMPHHYFLVGEKKPLP